MNSTDLGDGRVVAAGLVVFVACLGLVIMVVGATRHRSVSTGAAGFIAQVAAGFLAFALVGFPLGFAPGRSWIGTEWFGLIDVDLGVRPDEFGGIAIGSWLLFHSMIAAVFVLIALAPMAERVRVSSQGVAGAVLAGVVLPMAMRSVWGEGLIADIDFDGARFVDAGGAGVVGVLAGWVGLTGAMLIGPRLGKFGPTGRSRVIPGRSIPVATIGAMTFVVGWLGVLVGRVDLDAAAVGGALMSALLAASAGAVTAMLVSWRRSGRAGSLSALRGLVAGLVSVSAAVPALTPLSAVVVGAVAGVIAIVFGVGLERARVDDPLGVVAMFGAAGVWGVVAVGLFAESGVGVHGGLLTGGDANQLLAQLVGLAILSSWGIVAGAAVFGLLGMTRRLRLTDEEELVGLSVSEQSVV